MAVDTKMEAEIARLVRREVGAADPQVMRTIVEEVLQAVAQRTAELPGREPSRDVSTPSAPSGIDIRDCVRCRSQDRPENRNRGVITATGLNCTGIVAKFATIIAEYNVDILDISQTIVGGFFTMIILVNLDGLEQRRLNFTDLKQRLLSVSKNLGIQTIVVHEEIFRGMQRI